MAALPPIVLSQWQYSTDKAVWRTLSTLADWPQQTLSTADKVYLRHSVYLSPTDFCVRYLLHLEAAPKNTQVYVNGWQVGTTGGESFRANVTDQVALDDNLIELTVCQPGTFGRVYLQAVPCA